MCLPGTSARNKWIKDTTGVIIARANPKSFLLFLMINWNNITALFWTTTRAGKYSDLGTWIAGDTTNILTTDYYHSFDCW